MGILIALFAGYSLLARDALRLEHEHRPVLLMSGLAAGILGGAYGMNGPPLVVYGSLRRWSPQHFRATLQAYFLPASMLGMIGYWSAGVWTRAVTREFLYSVPVMLPAVFLGRAINRRFFRRRVYQLPVRRPGADRRDLVCGGDHASRAREASSDQLPAASSNWKLWPASTLLTANVVS